MGISKGNFSAVVATCEKFGEGNPYIENFYGALADRGVECLHLRGFNRDILSKQKSKYDFFHFHWLHGYYDNSSLVLCLKNAFLFVVNVLYLRFFLRKKIILTLHNFMPHESRSKIVDWLVRFVVISTSSLIIVHSNYSKVLLKKYFLRRRGVVVMKHGSYIGNYPVTKTREAARGEIDVDLGAKVVLFFGRIKEYKGVLGLIDDFAKTLDSRLVLLVVGAADDGLDGIIRSRVAKDPRVKYINKFVDDTDVQTYFLSSDVVAFPFEKTLTSGSLMLAYSFSRPVLIPAIESVEEYSVAGGAFPYSAESLLNIMGVVEASGTKSKESWAASMEQYSWPVCVDPVVKRLEGVV